MARTIVSTQVIEWTFEDQVSQKLKQVEQNLNQVKQAFSQTGETTTFSNKVSEATQNVDKLTQANEKLKNDTTYDTLGHRMDRYSEAVKKTPKERYTEFKDNLQEKQSKLASFVSNLKNLPKNVSTMVELHSESAKSRMETYRRSILQLPKKAVTNLRALADKGVSMFKNSLSSIPKRIRTVIETVGAGKATRSIGEHSFSLKNAISFTTALAVAQKGLSAITGQLSSAFARSDAIHNYGKTLQILGFNSNDAADSQKRLTDMVTGTAFGLDQAAQSTKTFIATGRDLKTSEQITKDLMKAVTVFGDGSKASFDMVGMQMGQMAGKANANMGDLKTVMEQAPGFMNKVAEQMGYSMNDFNEAMSSGKISTEETFNAMHEVTEKFGDDVLKGNDTWQKVFDNSKAKITTSLAGMIENMTGKLDKVFGGSTKENIVKFFEGIGKQIERFGTFTGKVFEGLAPYIKVFAEIGKTIISGFVEPFKEVKKAIENVSKSAKDSPILKFFQNLAGQKDMLKNFGKVLGTLAIVAGSLFVAFKVFSVLANPFSLIIAGAFLLAKAFTSLYKNNSKFKNFVDSLWKNTQRVAKAIGKVISNLMKALKPHLPAIKKAFTTIMNGFTTVAKFIGKILGQVFEVIQTIVKSISSFVSTHSSEIKKTVEFFVKAIFAVVKFVLTPIIETVKGIMTIVSNVFETTWGSIKRIFKFALDAILDVFGIFVDVFSGNWGKLWEDMKKLFSDIWGGLTAIFGGVINAIFGIVNSMIDGIDKVWNFFSGHNTSIHHLQPVKFAEGGTVTDSRTIMVNDSKRTDWKELIQFPNGQLAMAKERNAVLQAPVGTRIYNGEQTKTIFNSFGIEKYEDGGVVGWIKGGLDNIGSWISDKFDAIKNFLKDPFGFIKETVLHSVGNMQEGLGNFRQISSGVLEKAMHIIADWMYPQLSKMNQSHEEEMEKGSGSWSDKIRQAAKKMKVSITDSDVGNILSLIQHESGGNEKVVQSSAVWDVNTASGNPAKGLLQYIPQTFAAYAMPGHTDIFNGFDQLLAFFNTSGWRNFNPMGGWGPSGPRRFALGGHVTEPTMALVGEMNGQDEYIINPHQPTAHALINEVSQKANINQTQSSGVSGEIGRYLREIIIAIRENKKVFIDIGGNLVEVTDKMIGENRMLNERFYMGGGTIDGDE